MAKKPTPKRKRMTKLQRRIHNEKVKLHANFFANIGVTMVAGVSFAAAFFVSNTSHFNPIFGTRQIGMVSIGAVAILIGFMAMYFANSWLNDLIEE